MAFSFLTQELAIDLGTANTVIFMKDKIVVDEPSIIAIDMNTKKPMAIGERARLMHERTNPNIKTIRPMKDGVIADFQAAEHMIRGFIKMINSKRSSLFTPNLRIVIAIPSGSTEVETRAVRDAAEHSGGRDVYIILEPMAAAIGIGLDVEKPSGHMVVDIGGGTTECAVISLGGIVWNESLKVAGDVFTSDIQQYMRQQYNIKIGEITAEEIKIAVGAAIPELETTPEPYIAKGPNLMTAYPVEVPVTSMEIAHCLDKSLAKLESTIIKVLEQTPPELYADIVKEGIYLSGGGALIRGLDKRLSDKLKIPFHVAEDPLRAVARGTNTALKNLAKRHFLPYLMR
ncbi:MAG: rod shape-determining protein [Bacteroidales bacterium]|nr:rod shape-determining protein [Bacteroidales bacterium]MBQ1886239.1 rod shape-determining protein [Bacteroidales bacterium]